MSHSVAEHLNKANNNKAFAATIDRDGPTATGWAITALFYSALHFVQAFLVSISAAHVRSHSERERHVEQLPQLASIYLDYRDLQTLSKNSRYEMAEYDAETYAEAFESLSAVERHVQGLLAPAPRVGPKASGSGIRTSFMSKDPRPMPGLPPRRPE